MRKLILTVGLPGAGKSSTLRQLGLEDFTLSFDALRLLLTSPVMAPDGRMTIDQSVTPEAIRMAFELLERRMQAGETVLVDAVHAHESELLNYVRLANRYRYDVAVLDFRNVPLGYSQWANESRPEHRIVPARVMSRFEHQLKSLHIPFPTVFAVAADQGHVQALQDWLNPPMRDFNRYRSVVHVGDIQGCATVLARAFPDGLDPEVHYVFVGDLVDRGIENAETIRWFLAHAVGRPNVTLLWGNHEDHLDRFAREEPPVSPEFRDKTLPQLLAAGLTPREVEPIVAMAQDVLTYRYRDREVLVTHGGLPKWPTAIWQLPSRQLQHGVAAYDAPIDAMFEANTKPHQYQVHGHRNPLGVGFTPGARSLNLENRVEFGGTLRVATLDEAGFRMTEIANPVFGPADTRGPRRGYVKPAWLGTEGVALTASELDGLLQHPEIKAKAMSDAPHVLAINFSRNAMNERLWDDLNIRARGLFVDRHTRHIVARSYDKFFNAGEFEDYEPEALAARLAFPIRGSRKENGFIGITGFDPVQGRLVTASKSTTTGLFADLFRTRLQGTLSPTMLDRFAWDLRDMEASAVFEVIDPVNDPHIVEYPEAKLVLLDVVARRSRFERLPLADLLTFGKKYGFEIRQEELLLPDARAYLGWRKAFMAHDRTTHEGYVFADDAGFMFKEKSPYYTFWKLVRGQLERRQRQVERASDGQIQGLDTLPACQVGLRAVLAQRGLGWMAEKGDQALETLFKVPSDLLSTLTLAELRKRCGDREAGPASYGHDAIIEMVR